MPQALDFSVPVSSSAEPDGLLSADLDGFKVQWKNDGFDYPALWRAFRAGQLAAQPLTRGRPFRATDRAEAGGRSFLFKRDWHVERRWEKKLLFALLGATRYSRIIQMVNRAVRQGCSVVQDIYLTAERFEGRTCLEAYLIADFMPGQILPPDEKDHWIGDLVRTVQAIHDCGLACNDIQSYNFIRTDDGIIKGIDMDISSPLVICQVNDLWTMKYRFGVKMPVGGGPLKKTVWALVGLRNCLRNAGRKIRGVPTGV